MTYREAVAKRDQADRKLAAISAAQADLLIAGDDAAAEALGPAWVMAMREAVAAQRALDNTPMPINYVNPSAASW